MKIRVGFVTNSSSTGYCIIGIEGGAIIEKIVGSLGVCPDVDDVHRFLDQALSGQDIVYLSGYHPPYGVLAIGEIPERALRAATLPQAREAIADKLSRIFNINVSVGEVELLYVTV